MADKKIRRKRKVSISPVTIYLILFFLIAFAVLNFYVFPKLYESQKGPIFVDIPTIKRGNSSFVDSEVEKRTLNVPTLIAPANKIGKTNPFEEER